MTVLRVKVLNRRPEAEGIDSFELGLEGGGSLPGFSAGSHIDVHLPNGMVRQYSLCNDSAERQRYRIAVLRDPASRGGSAAMHEQVKAGDLLTISEPRNHFPLERAPHTLMLGGGIGITPLLCMAQRLKAIGDSFELHYCTRSLSRTAFRDELIPFGSRAKLHIDDGPQSQKLDLPVLLNAQPAGARLYVCGPTGFIDFVAHAAKSRGWPADHTHVEHFGGARQDISGDREFRVKLASTGKTYTISAEKSVATALREQGVEFLVSCEQGVCGTCLTRVLEGQCDHRDLYLTQEEKAANNQFMPCCSRSKGPLLVLDL